jgi:tetratricopeptide (TPR) repeat protein
VIGVAIILTVAFGVAALAGDSASDAFKRGMELRERGDLTGALTELRKAEQINPALPEAHREIGLILIEQREFDSAAAELRRAVELNPKDNDSRYNLAMSLANAGALKEALDQARLLVRSQPHSAISFFGLGHIQALARNDAAAIQSFRIAVRLDAKLYRAWFELGKLLEKVSDREGAIDAYQHAVAVDPQSAAARYRLAVLLKNQGRPAAAASEFKAAREIQRNRADGEQAAVLYLRGADLLEKGEYDQAADALQSSLVLRPDFEETRTALVEAYLGQGAQLEQQPNIAAAIDLYRHASTLAPSAEIENHLGVLLARTGQLEAAIDRFRRALKLDPGFKNAQRNLAQALAMQSAGRP